MKSRLLLGCALALASLAGAVSAQTAWPNAYYLNDKVTQVPVTPATPLPVTTSAGAASGTPTQTSVSCGTSTTTLLAANTATQFIIIKIPASAANAVWFNFAGVAAVTAPPSEDLAAGASQTFSPATGYLPTSAIACIGSAAVTVTLIYR